MEEELPPEQCDNIVEEALPPQQWDIVEVIHHPRTAKETMILKIKVEGETHQVNITETHLVQTGEWIGVWNPSRTIAGDTRTRVRVKVKTFEGKMRIGD